MVLSLVLLQLECAHTHLQKLIKKAERVNIVEAEVVEPVSKLAALTQFGSIVCIIFQVTVSTFPLQFHCSSSL